MKKTILILWLAISLSSISAADTIILVADKWCPYNCTPETERPGFLVEIARRAFELAGHKLEYRLMPWKRAVTEAKRGNVNGIIGFGLKSSTHKRDVTIISAGIQSLQDSGEYDKIMDQYGLRH